MSNSDWTKSVQGRPPTASLRMRKTAPSCRESGRRLAGHGYAHAQRGGGCPVRQNTASPGE